LKHARPSVFIALAKGQGGTQFEEDPAKRDIKDSWQVLQLAQKNGFILTECFNLNESKFPIYKSTGFRSQAKSFATKSSLIHRFEPSLAVTQANESSPECIRERLKDNCNSGHPLSELKRILAGVLNRKFPELTINYIDEIYLNNKTTTSNNKNNNNNFALVEERPVNSRESKQQLKTMPDRLNLFSELLIKEKKPINNSLESISELNKINYLILVKYNVSPSNKSSADMFLFSKQLNNELHLFIKSLSQTEISESCLKSETTNSEFTAIIDASLLLTTIFDLDDERLLYSDDKRTIVTRTSPPGLNAIRAYSIQNPKWMHDISFWYIPKEFDFPGFAELIQASCMGYVRSIELLNIYRDESSGRHSACFRFVYQSCDRALSWEATSEMQMRFRKSLEKEFKSVKLR